MHGHITKVLGFLNAAQTVLAVYGSPTGPTDPEACYNVMVQLLEDPELLRAQLALTSPHKIVILMGEPFASAPIL